jgi:hypothetical protein
VTRPADRRSRPSGGPPARGGARRPSGKAPASGEVAELRDELATMNALLRIQTKVGDGAVDHFVREWMKQLRELAYDAEDCVHLYIFRIKCGL